MNRKKRQALKPRRLRPPNHEPSTLSVRHHAMESVLFNQQKYYIKCHESIDNFNLVIKDKLFNYKFRNNGRTTEKTEETGNIFRPMMLLATRPCHGPCLLRLDVAKCARTANELLP